MLSQSSPSACLQFDEFLARNIHSQLSNFCLSRTFRFLSLILNLFLSFNENNIQLLNMVITEDMCKYYCKFMSFLMALVYEVLFQKRLPRVLLEMKKLLQLSPERRVGDWFLSMNNTVIRVYGFIHQLYVLLTFLTLKMFA